MFQTFISRHNSNFFSDKLVLTSVTPASSAPVLQTPKATSSTLYFDSLTVNAGNGEIGRASCRERVWSSVDGGSDKKKQIDVDAQESESERIVLVQTDQLYTF